MCRVHVMPLVMMREKDPHVCRPNLSCAADLLRGMYVHTYTMSILAQIQDMAW
jgi:hypothetical protein